jgi:hypothetical protein
MRTSNYDVQVIRRETESSVLHKWISRFIEEGRLTCGSMQARAEREAKKSSGGKLAQQSTAQKKMTASELRMKDSEAETRRRELESQTKTLAYD